MVACTAVGGPIDSFYFTHNSQILIDDENTEIFVSEEIAGNVTVVIAILSVCMVTHDVAGEYSCVAENLTSMDTATFNVELSTGKVLQ